MSVKYPNSVLSFPESYLVYSLPSRFSTILIGFWAFPCGSGFALQSFCSFLTKRISTSIPNANSFSFKRVVFDQF